MTETSKGMTKPTLIVTVVIDNNPSKTDPTLSTEHGLSFHLEVDGHSWLYDVGASRKWATNANHLGIDIHQVEQLICSHGHRDHTGGLATFFLLNNHAPVRTSKEAFNRNYFSYRHGPIRDISVDKSLIAAQANRIQYITHDTRLSPHVLAVRNQCHDYAMPAGNQSLKETIDEDRKPYQGEDELALAIQLAQGLVILSSCSHNGLLNITESCVQATGCSNVLAFIGGLHLVDSPAGNNSHIAPETIIHDDVQQIARQIKEKYPNLHLYTGHCTGPKAMAILQKELGDHVHSFHSGFRIEI